MNTDQNGSEESPFQYRCAPVSLAIIVTTSEISRVLAAFHTHHLKIHF
jgi:hypothetical protein